MLSSDEIVLAVDSNGIGVWATMGIPWEVAGGPMGLPREMGC